MNVERYMAEVGGDMAKAPNAKDQAPENLQVPKSKIGPWLLDILWGLDVEAWFFSFVPSVPFCSKIRQCRQPVPAHARPCQPVPVTPHPTPLFLRCLVVGYFLLLPAYGYLRLLTPSCLRRASTQIKGRVPSVIMGLPTKNKPFGRAS